MKTSCLALTLLISTLGTYGQVAGQPAAAQTGNVPAPTPYAMTKQDGNSRVLEREIYSVLPSGQVVTNKHNYTELGTGMNYQDAQGRWQRSTASFHMAGNFFVADKVPTRVILAPNLNITNAVTTVTADGITLSSTPVAIALYDAASGASLVIATITNCAGVLVASNQVVYANAFSGISADIYYTIKCGTFEQDVVITGRLNPEDYGFPTNTTQIQILTEFYQANKPEKIRRPLYVEKNEAVRNQMATPDLMDETLNFGQVVFGHGKAYTAANLKGSSAPVGKEYKTMSGRTFLVETLRYKSIQKELESLPAGNAPSGGTVRLLPQAKSGDAYAAIPKPGSSGTAKTVSTPNPRQIAALNKSSGVVIDYVEIYGSFSDATVFQGDTTYIIEYPSYYEGSLTIEGGAVIKYFSFNEACSPNFIEIDNALVCNTSAYRPAIFTAVDDNTVGENYPEWGSGSIDPSGYGQPELFLNNSSVTPSQTLGHLQFRYAQTAITMQNDHATVTINDSQFVNCIEGIQGLTAGCAYLNLNNCLMANVQSPSIADGEMIVQFLNCTIDHATQIAAAEGSDYGGVAICYNSILSNVTNLTSGSVTLLGDRNGFYNSPHFGSVQFVSSSYPFQAVGAGNYYLTDASGFRNQASASYAPANLQQKTTYPPILYSNVTVSINTTLSPQAQRDTDTPDLGYHYDPLDYLVDTFAVTNATLTINSGTVIAADNTVAGIWLQDGSSISSIGTAASPNWFVHYSCVQEQPVSFGSGTYLSIIINSYHSNPTNPNGIFQFNKFATLAAGCGYYFYNNSSWAYNNLLVQNCELWNSGNDFSGAASIGALVENNLFARSSIYAFGSATNYSLSLSNNLIYGTSANLNSGSNSNSWFCFNNDFDSCAISTGGGRIGPRPMVNGYNAYLNCSNRLTPTNAFDIVSTNGLAYQSGPLGNFYQPTNSLLINAGSTNASLVGLYHYTVLTSQMKETNSIVDIGYHYVALNINGLPFDTDGDGGPDYVEDANGNGLVDNGENSWTNYNSPNGITTTNGLLVFTPLK